MRTTLTIDDDVLAAARDRARREKRSVGEVMSELARTALTTPRTPTEARSVEMFGFLPFPPTGQIVTNELIDRLREEEGV